MKIAVISDTHYGDKTRNIPTFLFDHLEKIQPELILHAGDIVHFELLERLEEIAPTLAVRGNVDQLNLPEEKIVEVGDVKIGMIHGHQLISLNAHFLTLKGLEMGVNILVFGHTHRYYYDVHSLYGSRVILLNPGSPVFPRMDSPGFAVLQVIGNDVRVRRITFW